MIMAWWNKDPKSEKTSFLIQNCHVLSMLLPTQSWERFLTLYTTRSCLFTACMHKRSLILQRIIKQSRLSQKTKIIQVTTSVFLVFISEFKFIDFLGNPGPNHGKRGETQSMLLEGQCEVITVSNEWRNCHLLVLVHCCFFFFNQVQG